MHQEKPEPKPSQKSNGYMSASEVAQELGINLPTLYSYVSRGVLRSESADASKRTRRYHAEDVQRLKDRQIMRRDPQKVVDAALHWGTPILPSALTLIEGGRFYYRGQDALDLARNSTVEHVAQLMWMGEIKESKKESKKESTDELFAQPVPPLPSHIEAMRPFLDALSPLERCQVLLPVLAAEDLASYDFRHQQVALTGARILRRMTSLMTSATPTSATPTSATSKDTGREESLAAVLQRVWVPDQPQAISLFNAALVLCADHELNVSSFTARCVASAGSPPYAVVSAGLAALQGVKHGGMSARVEALFRETGNPDMAPTTLAQRIRRGENVPGFGHRLYPEGDPRGRLLLELVTATCPQSSGVELALALREAGTSILHDQPNIDFALATLCAALELPSGTAIALFALGRTVGWIGHAIEEYQSDHLIRPRAHYTGVLP